MFPCHGPDVFRCSLDILRFSRMFFKRHKLRVPMSWVRCSLDILRCSRMFFKRHKLLVPVSWVRCSQMFSRCSQIFEDVLQEAQIACSHVLGQIFEDVLICSLTILRCSQMIFKGGTNSCSHVLGQCSVYSMTKTDNLFFDHCWFYMHQNTLLDQIKEISNNVAPYKLVSF